MSSKAILIRLCLDNSCLRDLSTAFTCMTYSGYGTLHACKIPALIQSQLIKVSLLQLGPVLFGLTEDLFEWLRTKQLLASTQDYSSAEVNKSTTCEIYRWLREVCSANLLKIPIVLGGNGIIVLRDEFVFQYKVK